jgi:hypothetical protein
VLPLTEAIIRSRAATEDGSLALDDSEAAAGARGGRAAVDRPLPPLVRRLIIAANMMDVCPLNPCWMGEAARMDEPAAYCK